MPLRAVASAGSHGAPGGPPAASQPAQLRRRTICSVNLVADPLAEYALAHTKPLSPLLDELLAATRARMGQHAMWALGPIEATFLQVLAQAMGARRILEIGTFTGFSTLMMAAALPDDGQIVTCELDPGALAIAREFFGRSPDHGKIDVREGPALDTMATLVAPFDLVFVDADKPSYVAYYEAALPLLAPRGVVVADNVLWRGRVLQPQTEDDRAVVAFAAHVQRDPRVTNVLLTTGDGMMLIRRRE